MSIALAGSAGLPRIVGKRITGSGYERAPIAPLYSQADNPPIYGIVGRALSMNSDQSLPDAVICDGAGAGSNARTPWCFLGAATLLEVMQEQLGYLLGHGDGRCPTGCPDCARLEEAKECLLRPFA